MTGVHPSYQFGIVTLLPELLAGFLSHGVVGRAFASGLLTCDIINPRVFVEDAHHTIDDRPYGGGPGMVMMAEPLAQSVDHLKAKLGLDTPVCYLSPQGEVFSHQKARVLAQALPAKLILVCGRYEGVDERFLMTRVDFQLSVGDYVLSGGELPAQIVMDALARFIPGVLGDQDSAVQDSFESGLLDHPHYTRPWVWEGLEVPEVLRSGHHEKIEAWRLKTAMALTKSHRPDLWEKKL